MATPNLGLVHIASAQNQKEVTANANFDGLDEAMCGNEKVSMADSDVTLTPAQACGALVFIVSGALTAARNLFLPANPKPYVISNQTTGGLDITVQTGSAGAGTFSVPADSTYKLLYSDGTNVIHLT